MNACHLLCKDAHVRILKSADWLAGGTFTEVELPLTAINLDIDILLVGPALGNALALAESVSDWIVPPVVLFIFEPAAYQEQSDRLRYHPRAGRSLFFCKDTESSIAEGLSHVRQFYECRRALNYEELKAGNYSLNNISQRWLFQAMMKHMDEYIYFKDRESRFLAISDYLAQSLGRASPDEILGRTDFDFFHEEHSQEAFHDERAIVAGKIEEVHKEEHVTWDGHDIWVHSRKMPLRTQSGFIAGNFGLSRDITHQKELHQELEANHERMESELVLARTLQEALMRRKLPAFNAGSGKNGGVEVATKYIPSFHLSGDFFSIVKTPDGGAGILVADVMGHGVRSAMVTAMIQIAVNQLHADSAQPEAFMKRLNKLLHESMMPGGKVIFATAIYCHIDTRNHRLAYVQAGASHGVYVPNRGEDDIETLPVDFIGPALGLLADTDYREQSLAFNPGDEMLLYTDGILEAVGDGQEYGQERFNARLRETRHHSLQKQRDGILGDVLEFTHAESLDDDVCLIALRMPE